MISALPLDQPITFDTEDFEKKNMPFFDRGADERSKNGIIYFSKSRVSKVMGPAMAPQNAFFNSAIRFFEYSLKRH